MIKAISQIEKDFLLKTMNYVQNIFSGHHLPSHDHTHHLRVWEYAKEYLLEENNPEKNKWQEEIMKIFFCCFFHDTGMIVTLDKSHGRESRKIFEKFASEHLHLEKTILHEINKAIEMHDEKEAISLGNDDFADISNTLQILSVCDDLDAFGAAGILRYTEIYLMRKIPIHEIPEKVLNNLIHRTNYFNESVRHMKVFHSFHAERAAYIMNFFKRAKNQNSKEFKLIQAVHENVIVKKMNYPQFIVDLAGENYYPELTELLWKELKPDFPVGK